MGDADRAPVDETGQESLFRAIAEGTAAETGAGFFRELVRSLARALGVRGAWVTEYFPEPRRLRSLAFWLGDAFVEGYEYVIDGTPCAPVIDGAHPVHIPDRAIELYPDDPELRTLGVVSYLGHPLQDLDGRLLGHLAVLDDRPMPAAPRTDAVFRIFAARAAAELRRLRAEAALRRSEGELRRLVDGAMDAILELDGALTVSRANPAAERLFGVAAGGLAGADFGRLVDAESREKMKGLVLSLEARGSGESAAWIAGGLSAYGPGREPFPAEATLARSQSRPDTPYYTLVLRNVNERMEAESRIHRLTSQAAYLREELEALQGFDEIVGRSPAILETLRLSHEVAETDATVLLTGETGTGKELLARAIHGRSRRRDQPLITVNCAAIPETLLESVFFGHEAGAFTGATRRQEGRFALADRGTLFLDEIGELPLALQPKLLRALQEGEFEPLGSPRTRRVNVRVIAATNRDLSREVREGRFREDLYYRLAVFPIAVPALRDRREDIAPMAQALLARIARRMGRAVPGLGAEAQRRLAAYDWPGNVRELQNVLERAVITARDDQLDLERVLGAQNILRALETTGWKVAGEAGAASLLGIKPSTLSSRMKSLGIRRPR